VNGSKRLAYVSITRAGTHPPGGAYSASESQEVIHGYDELCSHRQLEASAAESDLGQHTTSLADWTYRAVKYNPGHHRGGFFPKAANHGPSSVVSFHSLH